MKYCTKCLYNSEHPLGIVFDVDGTCSGCTIHKEKFIINWAKKKNELELLLNGYRNKSDNNWDCIIPISGSRDSFYIVDKIKNNFKMNPLLVTYNKHYNSHTGNRNIAYLKSVFDCDCITLTVNPDVIKNITRFTLKNFGSIYWHSIVGEMVFPVRIAVNFKVPLIIWGVHQGIDQVGMFSHEDMVEMNMRYRIEHDFMGFEAKDFISKSNNLTEENLSPFKYPSDEKISAVGVRGIFLSNYMPWDTKIQHESMIKKYGYKTSYEPRTIDCYNNIDSMVYTDIHDFIKYIKHGYTTATDHLTREIRWGRISRENALELQSIYFNQMPRYFDIFFDWLKITEDDFFIILDKYINNKFFKSKVSSKQIYNQMINCDLSQDQNDFIKFISNDLDKTDTHFSLIEKGYEDIYYR